MGQFSKNLNKALAQQALNVGGISQEQEQANKAFEQAAEYIAELVMAGHKLQSSWDPDDHMEFENLLEGQEAAVKQTAARLLEGNGAAIRSLFMFLTDMHE